MKCLFRHIISMSIVFCCQAEICLLGQSDSVKIPDNSVIQEEIISSKLERIAENNEQEMDYSEIEEMYAYYREHKINMNQPDYDVLMSIFNLSDYQIYHLKRYLDLNGSMQTMYELAAIEGFTKETINFLLPYVEIMPSKNNKRIRFKDVFTYGKNSILMRYVSVLESQAGYKNVSDSALVLNQNIMYQGSKPNLLFKYKFDYQSKIRFGFTAEKDAGEEFFKGSNKYGFDFYSFHIFLKDIGFIKSLAIGDYQIQFGQGLVMWIGYQSQKPTNGIDVFHYAKTVTPYTSSNEINYLRGIASELQFKKVRCTFWYSYRKKDATLSDTSSNEEVYLLSLQETGYHRTLTEIEREKTFHQQTAGIFGQYFHRIFRVGAGVFYSHYNTALNKELEPYNRFIFNGQDLLNASISYSAVLKKVSIFGENAMSDNGGFALLNGLTFYADPLFTLTLAHRYYSRNYQAIQSASFGESSTNANETGVFLGFQSLLNKYLTWNSYIDYFRFMWLKYNIDAPSDGYEIFTQITCNLNPRCVFYLRFKSESKGINEATEYYNQVVSSQKQSYRFHISAIPISPIQLKSCLEYIVLYYNTKTDKQDGFLLYQDISWKIKWVTITGRYALFQTDSYDTRLYAYESDVLYASSIPAYFYSGSRFYLMIKTEITSYIDLWVRLSQTYYKNKFTVSSDLDEIDGNSKTDIRLQLLVKF